ncbi:Heparan sulfate glucosamine 3-O-sulfotransferase 6 [Holothuria leucospilota]|uniref:Heparan sulfate glucosamine 3-O-sulfotransferase 6 n=1 Tax=Holothuria leucospilota TaxID=206669 RepID=A0A9Q1CRK3_HOLLE|nr:Heparan sulfate glucosamine 3-O-sulfotransferase 6 [Holothuria leucospilota]
MNTLKQLPRKTLHHFCENLSKLADDKKFTYWRLPTVERWEVALRSFWSIGLEQRLPDVLGIGVKKSGTNAVVHFLKQHPLIKVPHEGKEIHFFDKHYSSGIQFYKANMPLVNESQLCFEKTPRYFVTGGAPKNIAKDILPKPKFLLCVRDPVKRALSDWHHETLIKTIKGRGRSSGVRTAESEGKRFAQEVIRNDGTVNTRSDFIRTSIYDIHFERWLMYHSREQFLILEEEDISSDPYQEMKRIEQFLGIGSFFKKKMFAYNKGKQVMCFVHENHREDCPPRYGVKIPHPTPTKGVIQTMRDFYRSHNKRFEDMLGMKFYWSDL